MSTLPRAPRHDAATTRPKLDRPTQDKVFAELDAIGKKFGAVALPAMRRYLTLYKERARRRAEIARLESELNDLKRKG